MTIRRATAADLAAFAEIVDAAYAIYLPRLGRKPMPMLDDHAARIHDQQAWVAEQDGAVAGVLVLIAQPDHLLLDNIAVAPARRGTGVGRALLEFAEAEAVRRGLAELRLYTNAMMVENIALYQRIGYRETGRGVHQGLRRVNFAKPVAGAPGTEIAG